MRAPKITAALAALALATPVSAAAQGNPLSSIFGCDAGGNKQAGGAVIGGLVGGVVGSNLAKNERTVGTVLGAAAGAAAGSYIGCRMQRSDQQKAQAATQYALDHGGSQSWSNAETGASGDVRVISTSNGGGSAPPVSMSGLRFARGVEPAGSFEAASGRYTAPKAANIRGTPSTSGAIVGKLSAGQSFEALGRVSGTQWLLAGRDGVGIGYVSDTVVRAAGGHAGNSVCRTFDQTIRTQSGAPQTERYTACKGADGQWVVQN